MEPFTTAHAPTIPPGAAGLQFQEAALGAAHIDNDWGSHFSDAVLATRWN
jgi:hypothetical protein